MNRIKRISTELLQKYPDKFGTDFDANKKTINEVAVVTSKVLRNELAGYITSHRRKEAAQQKAIISEDSEETEESTDE
ncbi:MAG: 30S ribosomal protein S17e [Nitrososphaera sp.]|nr:30S ribosomal protein S17e [Nitrososphaera sp.]